MQKTSYLVKSEDLNHHGTLFAGRMSTWFVETSFIKAATLLGNPESLVCLKVHGIEFKKPAQKGDIIQLTSTIAKVGRTSITIYTEAKSQLSGNAHVSGYTTFVCVDENGKSKAHGIHYTPETEEEKERYTIAKGLQ